MRCKHARYVCVCVRHPPPVHKFFAPQPLDSGQYVSIERVEIKSRACVSLVEIKYIYIRTGGRTYIRTHPRATDTEVYSRGGLSPWADCMAG